MPGATVINYEPSVTIAVDPDCRQQLRISVETRTNAYQVRMGEYPEEQLSVYVTARQYGSLDPDKTFVQTLDRLRQLCHETIDQHVAEHILRPLGPGDFDSIEKGVRGLGVRVEVGGRGMPMTGPSRSHAWPEGACFRPSST